MRISNASQSRVNPSVSKSGFRSRVFARYSRYSASRAGFATSSCKRSPYSSGESAISSGNPTALSRLAPTRPSQLVALVETRQHERILGQAVGTARRRRRQPAVAVIDIVAARQTPDALVKEPLLTRRDHVGIGHY